MEKYISTSRKPSDQKSLRRSFSVQIEKTILELRGTRCFELSADVEPNRQIICSRSFGRYIGHRRRLGRRFALPIAKRHLRLAVACLLQTGLQIGGMAAQKIQRLGLLRRKVHPDHIPRRFHDEADRPDPFGLDRQFHAQIGIGRQLTSRSPQHRSGRAQDGKAGTVSMNTPWLAS